MFQTFLYLYCWHRVCHVFVYLDCVGGLYLAHISLKKKKIYIYNRMYQVFYPDNMVLVSLIHIMQPVVGRVSF